MACRVLSDAIPSKVKHIPWIYAEPSIQTLRQDYDPEKVGKWMLFLDRVDTDANGLTKLDLRWPLITNLVQEGILIDAKCSTAFYTDKYTMSANGVINCYTDDYTNKDHVYTIAKSIRKVIDYSQKMFYKAELETEHTRRQSRHNCDVIAMSIYQYSIDNKLYERDEFARWQLVPLSKSCLQNH